MKILKHYWKANYFLILIICSLTGVYCTGCSRYAPQPEAAPVNLYETKAKLGDPRVRIFWRTETETDSFGYYIYRSDDSENFYCINEDFPVIAAGTTITPHVYVYYDLALKADQTYYYRILQKDLDGTDTWVVKDEVARPVTPKRITEKELEEIESRGAIFSEPAY